MKIRLSTTKFFALKVLESSKKGHAQQVDLILTSLERELLYVMLKFSDSNNFSSISSKLILVFLIIPGSQFLGSQSDHLHFLP